MITETPSVKIFLKRAEELGIEVTKLGGTPVFEYKYKNRRILFNECRTLKLSNIAAMSCVEKYITKNLLKNVGVQTPNWMQFYKSSSKKDIKKWSSKLNFPLIVKPYDGSHADNITMNINNIYQVVTLVTKLQKITDIVLVEEMFHGEEIRIYATRKKFLAAVRRRPASVKGDEKHTIQQLIKIKNSQPKRAMRFNDTLLRQIELGKEEIAVLKKQGLKPTYKPAKKERVFLREVSNLACGGDSIDITDQVHSSVKSIAVKAVKAVSGLPFAGIDFMTKDFTVPQTSKNYSILEVNCNARINLHHYPYIGKSRDVAGEILKELFQI